MGDRTPSGYPEEAADIDWARDFIARAESIAETHGAEFGPFVFESLCSKLRKLRVSRWLGIPSGLTLANGGVACDLLVGACACGATHMLDELPARLRMGQGQPGDPSVRHVVAWMRATYPMNAHAQEWAAEIGHVFLGEPRTEQPKTSAPSASSQGAENPGPLRRSGGVSGAPSGPAGQERTDDGHRPRDPELHTTTAKGADAFADGAVVYARGIVDGIDDYGDIVVRWDGAARRLGSVPIDALSTNVVDRGVWEAQGAMLRQAVNEDRTSDESPCSCDPLSSRACECRGEGARQARAAALDEAAQVAREHMIWAAEPGRMTPEEIRLVAGACNSVIAAISALRTGTGRGDAQ